MIKMKTFFLVLEESEDCWEIILSIFELDWRPAQIFAPGIDGYGAAAYFEVKFERDV
ncbi:MULTISPECIES: DUF4177 domain-containing protein [Bacillus amyloliquefaciens group]|uniref:DUF4177 domain-containing protein n=1 Tax=Bacillus amyloliquefaciens group TaxID=1938374 RepID=UPI002D7E9EF7|nr:DUF4177 domain-containing protein [Bacillus amyloliquefaciens]